MSHSNPIEPIDPFSVGGGMDIYLLDQVLRGRVRPGMRVFEAGCGQGRNLAYFLRAGHRVSAVDPASSRVRPDRRRATR